MRGPPQLLRHDAQLWRLATEPLALRPVEILLHAPAIALLDPVPQDLAAVERPEQDLADGRRRPSTRVARRRDRILVERLRDAREAGALGGRGEDPPDDRRLLGVDLADDVRALARGVDDLQIVVPVDLVAGDVAGARLPRERVIIPLARLLALHLVGEAADAHHELLGRRHQRALPILEVEPHPHAGLCELLQGVGRRDLLATEARLLGHNEDLERWPGLERVHQPQEARPFEELGAGDPVVEVDVLLGDRPALARGVDAGVLELASLDSLLSPAPACSVDLRA